jgi:O-antigen ligase
MALALLLTGGKTALLLALVATSATAIFYVSRDPRGTRAAMRILLTLGVILLLLPMILFTLERLSPVTYRKITEVFVGGVSDYDTIRSRNLIWAESVRLGMNNPVLGVGAGTRLLDVSHSHNVLLDYFRGIGLIGALSMLVLMVMAAWRTARFLLTRFGKGLENRWDDTFVAALYLGGFAYLLGNLLSDSLSPSTSFFFFLIYVTAVCSEMDGNLRRFRQGAVSVLPPDSLQRSSRLARQPSAVTSP